MKQESTVDLLLDVDQRPSAGKGILLSFQHVFAMFGATILVPLILGMPVSVALFCFRCRDTHLYDFNWI